MTKIMDILSVSGRATSSGNAMLGTLLSSVLWTTFAVAAPRVSSEEPVGTVFKKGTSPLVVNARVGDVEGRVALSATEPESYVVGDRSGAVTVSVKGREIARLSLRRPNGPAGVQAVLGMDALKGMAVGVDLTNSEVFLWPKGNLAEAEAKAWVSAYPGWNGTKHPVAALALDRTAHAYSIPVGDGKSRALFQMGLYGTKIGSGGPTLAGAAVKTSPQLVATRFSIAGRELPWFSYASGEDAAWAANPQAKGMTITLEALRSRRVLVDFAKDRLYYEELPADAILSLLLTEWFGSPFTVDRDTIALEPFPGKPWPTLGEYRGSEVLELAGIETAELLSLLRDSSTTARDRLAEMLAERGRYEIWIRMPSGKELILKPERG
jgi:hypothetical protein